MLRPSSSDNFPIPNPIESVRSFRLLRLGDGGLEVAGEKTPTPDSFSFENSDASNFASSPRPSRVGWSRASSGGVSRLSSVADKPESAI